MRAPALSPAWILVALLGMGRAALASTGSIQFDPAASEGFPSLEVPVGVRATGMGEAYTAAGDDVYALHWNPAGLASVRGYALGLSDNQWDPALGLSQNLVIYGQGLGSASGLAVSANYFNLGTLEERDANGSLLGSVSASVIDALAGFGTSFLDQGRLRAGLSLECVERDLFGQEQDGLGLGAGALYDLLPNLTVGASLNHLGVGLSGVNLPAGASAGLALRLPERHLTLALDAEDTFSAGTAYKAGVEYTISAVILRAGYRLYTGADATEDSGLSAGAGFHLGILQLDYSFTPYGDLSTVQRVQVTVDIPKGFFEPKIVYEEGTSTTAQIYFKLGQSFESKGETLKALMQYERCMDNYPPELAANPQDFYLQAQKRAEALQQSLSHGGGDLGEIHRLTVESLAAADKSMKAGHFKEAITRLQQALTLEPHDQALAAALKADQSAFDAKLGTFRDAARFAAKGNDLVMGVDNYRRLLALQADDAEALAFMAKHRTELKNYLLSIDRRAVYFYVAGKLEEAVKTWSEGAALDYFGDVDFQRNLQKARKQLELLEQETPTPTP
jgi:hypothetical protein